MPRKVLSAKAIDELIEDLRNGLSLSDAATRYAVSRSTIYYHAGQHGVPILTGRQTAILLRDRKIEALQREVNELRKVIVEITTKNKELSDMTKGVVTRVIRDMETRWKHATGKG